MINSNNIFTFENLAQTDRVIHGISTRKYGSMKSKGEIHFSNLRHLLEDLHIPFDRIAQCKQIHSGNIAIVQDIPEELVENVDGLITNSKNTYLGIVTADCLPVLLYDRKGIAGALHAGYKGIANHILENMVEEFKKKDSDPKEIQVGIGPAIGVCCYDVGKDRIEMFQKSFPYAEDFFVEKENKYFLDLKKLASIVLMHEGVPQTNIEIADLCTKEHLDTFYSYRGEGPETYGEFVSIIGIR